MGWIGARTHAHTHAHTFPHTHTHIPSHTHTHSLTHAHSCIHARTFPHTHAHTRTRVCVFQLESLARNATLFLRNINVRSFRSELLQRCRRRGGRDRAGRGGAEQDLPPTTRPERVHVKAESFGRAGCGGSGRDKMGWGQGGVGVDWLGQCTVDMMGPDGQAGLGRAAAVWGMTGYTGQGGPGRDGTRLDGAGLTPTPLPAGPGACAPKWRRTCSTRRGRSAHSPGRWTR